MPVLGELSDFWCEQCCKDLTEFWKLPENATAFDTEYPFDDQATQEKLAAEREAREKRQADFMKVKVLERRQNEKPG